MSEMGSQCSWHQSLHEFKNRLLNRWLWALHRGSTGLTRNTSCQTKLIAVWLDWEVSRGEEGCYFNKAQDNLPWHLLDPSTFLMGGIRPRRDISRHTLQDGRGPWEAEHMTAMQGKEETSHSAAPSVRIPAETLTAWMPPESEGSSGHPLSPHCHSVRVFSPTLLLPLWKYPTDVLILSQSTPPPPQPLECWSYVCKDNVYCAQHWMPKGQACKSW